MEIRPERESDHAAVRAVHAAAFARPGLTGAVREAWLVDQLRAGPWWLAQLSLVALSGEAVVGHVVATRATLEPSGTPVLGLGPLGVQPGWQRRGVGSALVRAVLAAAQATGESLVGVLGAPAYYGRFGFVPAAEHGVGAPDQAWGAAFQIRILGLPGQPARPAPTGTFRYAEPFDRLG